MRPEHAIAMKAVASHLFGTNGNGTGAAAAPTEAR
jgi:hypothetical protein